MRTNRVKQCIREGKLPLNTYFYLADPTVVEIIGLAGFDAVTIDLEHYGLDLGVVKEMIATAELSGITPIVRVPAGDWSLVLRVLELGAQGVQVTRVRNRQVAREAADVVRYPPMGQRGALGISRAARFGDVAWRDHVQSSNAEVLLILQVEDKEALEDLEGIAGVEGVDVIVIGPHDLAESMGIREPNDARLRQIVEDIAARLGRLGKAGLGLSLNHPMLPLAVPDLKRLGVVYTSIQPSVERRMLVALRDAVRGARDSR